MNTALTINLTPDAERMEARLVFRNIFGKSPEDIYTDVKRVQKRARQRKLDQADVEAFINDVVEMIELARKFNIPLRCLCGRLDAGGVPNSYKYRAETTAISIDGERIVIERRGARSVAGGDDGRHRVGFTNLDTATKKRLKAAGWKGPAWSPA